MKNYGIVRSAEQPPELEVTASMVFVASNILPYEYAEDEKHINRGFEYTLIGYTKDEYIKLLSEQNTELKTELLDTQGALCEVYEAVLGGE